MKKINLLVAITAILFSTPLSAQVQVKKSKAEKHAHTRIYQCPMKCEGNKTYGHKGKCPVCKMKFKLLPKQATATTYQCPMKCEGDKTYAIQGKCPVCKMNLKELPSMGKIKKNEHYGHSHQ